LREAIRRALSKESAEIRDAAKRRKNFVGWLDRFYGRWMEKMTRIVEPAAETCRMVGLEVDGEDIAFEHCKVARAAMLDLTGEVTPAELVERVERETAEWKRTVPDEIMRSVSQE